MNVHEAIENRRSVRDYDPRPIPEETTQKLLNALRYSPSACNFQPRRFVLITDSEQRGRIVNACNNQTWMLNAPLIVAGCGLPKKAYETMAGHYNTAQIDVSIALDHLTLAAAAEGLGTCWIGAFFEDAVKDILSVPDEATVVALMTIGYPKSPDLIRPVQDARRKAAEEVFGNDSY